MISIKKIRLKKEKRKKYQTCHRIFHAEKNHACINCTENISHPRINIVTITEVMDMRHKYFIYFSSRRGNCV